ncbi:hypothetical protein BCV70DRAFT_197830 [Testicularia cyperi]|uniref:Uncharacterized protein n=1 Tax=Testicularia cyperi TaxID=1882483 RepID=A0A317Y0P0_9BASI|nr:hypothetical protein BCV70DRAFT_197830 [Testicularia cyperi]
MVKFSLAPLALVAVLGASSVFAQESSVSSASSSMSSASGSSSASSAAPTSMSSSGGSGSGSNVCTALAGDPRSQPYGCPYSSTTVPPYDLSSLVSYLIKGYTRGPEAKSPDEVANEMAGTVLKYYPTLITPKSELQATFAEAISATINAIAEGRLTEADLGPAARNVPDSLLHFGAAAAAIFAAGAFVL